MQDPTDDTLEQYRETARMFVEWIDSHAELFELRTPPPDRNELHELCRAALSLQLFATMVETDGLSAELLIQSVSPWGLDRELRILAGVGTCTCWSSSSDEDLKAPPEIRRALGKAIRDERTSTQTELATRLGISQGSLSAWENGAVDLRLGQILALDSALGLRPGSLLVRAWIGRPILESI